MKAVFFPTRTLRGIGTGAVALAAVTLAAPCLGASPDWLAGAYGERLQAIRRATPADASSLEAFLAAAPSKDGQSLDELNALKNEAAVVLVGLPAPPADLAQRLLSMAADPATDAVWRDYCLQFLGQGFRRWSAADKKAAAAFLVEVAQREKLAIGGTALIALANNAAASEIGVDRVRALALAAVKDAAHGDAYRVTALQVCARFVVAEALPEARALATAASTQANLRISAIAALGALGDPSDETALRGLARNGDQRFRVPASTALQRLETRLSKPPTGVRP